MRSSASALSGKDSGNSHGQYLEVHPKGLGFDIVDVELHLAGEINLAATADLPDAGDAGSDGEPAAMGGRIFCDFARNRRPWSDQRHIADEDIVELRQLVQGELAQPFTAFG